MSSTYILIPIMKAAFMMFARSNFLFAPVVVAAVLSIDAFEVRTPLAATSQDVACISPDIAGKPVSIPGGIVSMGDDRFYPEEGPIIDVAIEPFEIDAKEVTNAEFATFVEATGYVTRAERGLPEPDYDHLPDEFRQPGSAVFVNPLTTASFDPAAWWEFTEGASWKTPSGANSSIEGKKHHPVIHITYEDAEAYARWKGRRLPTEAEWEAAARGGLEGATFSWGERSPEDISEPVANVWQGIFPVINDEEDGYEGTAPVGCFEPNPFGVYDMIGNVWEWTSDPYFPYRMEDTEGTVANLGNRPDLGYDPEELGVAVGVIKGGSHLCAANFCFRYRPAARQSQDLTMGTSHTGFRTAKSIDD